MKIHQKYCEFPIAATGAAASATNTTQMTVSTQLSMLNFFSFIRLSFRFRFYIVLWRLSALPDVNLAHNQPGLKSTEGLNFYAIFRKLPINSSKLLYKMHKKWAKMTRRKIDIDFFICYTATKISCIPGR